MERRYPSLVGGEFRADRAVIPSRNASRISLIAGLAVLGFAVFGLVRTAAPVCGNLARDYAPMIAFELARSVADLHAIFGDKASACRAAMATQMDGDNWVDSLLFIPLYGSFLVFFFLGMRDTAAGLSRAGVRLTIVGCAADYAENLCLFRLSGQPDGASAWLTRLAFATEVKWLLLGVVGLIGGMILWEHGRWFRLAIVPCAIGSAVSLTTIPTPEFAGPYLAPAISLGWIVFLLADSLTVFGAP